MSTKVSTAHVPQALADTVDQLAGRNPAAAARTVPSLTAATVRLRQQPQPGEQRQEFAPRNIRRILMGHHEVRCEIRDTTV